MVDTGVKRMNLTFPHALGLASGFDFVVPRYFEVMPFVHEAIDIFHADGRNIVTEAIPLCRLVNIRTCI